MTRRSIGALGLALVSLTLTACQPAHAEWQSQCVERHDEPSVMSMTVMDGNGNPTVQIVPTTDSVCDRYERICVAGRDGSTLCGVDTGR